MITSIKDCATLNNGVKMPWLGLGVWKITKPEEIDFAVKTALEAGYRSIDTAEVYGNEEGVGKAIRESGIPRDEIFITTKLANSEQRKGYDAALRAFEESRKRLGVEYIDLFLIHWPVKDKYVESWKALIKLYNDGLVRAIGVSNFLIHHLEDIISETGVVPAVNQVELHPWLNQSELVEFCQKHKIQVEAYSPLMGGRLAKLPSSTILRTNTGKPRRKLCCAGTCKGESLSYLNRFIGKELLKIRRYLISAFPTRIWNLLTR